MGRRLRGSSLAKTPTTWTVGWRGFAGDAIPRQIVGKIIRRDWDGRFQRARGGGRGFGGLQVARWGEGGKSGGESMAGRGGRKVEEDGNRGG